MSDDPETDVSMCGICGRQTSHSHVSDGTVLHYFVHPDDEIAEPEDSKRRMWRLTSERDANP